VFGVKGPADFGREKVAWTIKIRGKAYGMRGPDGRRDGHAGVEFDRETGEREAMKATKNDGAGSPNRS
jgi:hypothetical protein